MARPMPEAAPGHDVGPAVQSTHGTSSSVAPGRPGLIGAVHRSSPGVPGALTSRGAHAMKFALFYEIPVPRPWEEDSELIAYQNTLEQAIAGDKFGWHAFWTVEHHFLQEYSHCSNPEILYGAIASRTENIRLGYGVRLMPKPYNHPVRTAESVAVLDLLSERPGRPRYRALGHPGRARGLRRRPRREPPDVAGGHRAHRGLLDQRGVRVRGRVLADAPAPGAAQAVAEAPPALCGAPPPATRATHRWATWASACARSPSGLPPSEVKRKIDVYRAAVEQCTQPIGAFVNNQAATFTMALCGPDAREGERRGPRVLRVVPQDGRPPDRHADGLDGGAQAGARDLLVRRRHEEDRRRGHPRPVEPGVPRRRQRLCARDARGMRRGRAGPTRRRGSTCCSAWSTRTRSRTSRSCRRSSSWGPR